MTHYLVLTKCSHHFSLTQIHLTLLTLINQFSKRLIRFSFTNGSNGLEPTCVFAASTKGRTEFRFHINHLEEFENFMRLNGIPNTNFLYIEKPLYEPKKINYVLQEKWLDADREHQTPIIDYIVDNTYPIKFVGLQTGGGKTFITAKSIFKLQQLAVGIIRPMYIDKWARDLQNYFHIDPQRILIVEGSKNLLIALEMAKNNTLDFDFILFSNKTIQNWIKLYEAHGKETLDFGYSCFPQDLHELLQTGVFFVDEVHQDFHLNFKLHLYTHVHKSISLSGTLQHKEDFMKYIYNIAFPLDKRYKVPDYKKSAHVVNVNYRFNSMNGIRTNEYGSKNYSHNRLENSIMKDPKRRLNYFNLINSILKDGYFKNKKPDQKALIYAYRKDFCADIRNYLRKQYPNLTIEKFVDEDPDTNLYDSDICVSTLGSASTAHDIKNLKCVANTVNVESEQTNLQALGRLRPIEGVDTTFYYLTCLDIPKHIRYHQNKKELFSGKVLSHIDMNAPSTI